MAILSLYSMKGGVGKTTTAVNLAFLCAKSEGDTLLCDLDPQGAASFYLRIRPHRSLTAKKVLGGPKRVRREIMETDFGRLFMLPSTLSFRTFDIRMSREKDREKRLGGILRKVSKDFAHVFIDSPPSLTLLSEGIIAASDIVLVPMIPTTLSLMSYTRLMDFLSRKSIDTGRVYPFVSMYDGRRSLHRTILRDLSREFPHALASVIPASAMIERMGEHRKPLCAYSTSSPEAGSYSRLWGEIRAILSGSG